MKIEKFTIINKDNKDKKVKGQSVPSEFGFVLVGEEQEQLTLTLANGTKLTIMDRNGRLSVSTNIGRILVHPIATNLVEIERGKD